MLTSSATGQPPTVVNRLVDVLVQDSGCAISTSVRSMFQAQYPRLARQTSESAFTSDMQLGTKAVWNKCKTSSVSPVNHRRSDVCSHVIVSSRHKVVKLTCTSMCFVNRSVDPNDTRRKQIPHRPQILSSESFECLSQYAGRLSRICRTSQCSLNRRRCKTRGQG